MPPASAQLLLRRARRFFAGPRRRAAAPSGRSAAIAANPGAGRSAADNDGAFTGQRERFAVAQTTVRAFYALTLYFLMAAQFPEFSRMIERPPLAPLWPAAWLHWTPTPNLGVKALLGFYTATALAGAFLPGQRWARTGAWLGLLELIALKNSYGKIGHSLHLLILVAFILIFLPDGWTRPAALLSRRTRQSALLVHWTCQAALLLSYTMSGLGKLGGALYQLALGQPNAFSPGGIGAHVAERLLQTHSHSLLGDWIIYHPWLTWPMMPGAIYVELFAFWVAFRPALARLWAGALIVFHLGVFFSMTINFPQNCLLLALFFFQSPFQPARTPWRQIIADLPMAAETWRMTSALRRKFDWGRTKSSAEKPADSTSLF